MKKILVTIVICMGIIAAAFYVLDNQNFQDRKFAFAAKHFLGSKTRPVNLDKAVKTWTKLAEADHALSQCYLGFLYERGYRHVLDAPSQEIPVNLKKSWHWANLAAENDCKLAQYQISTWHLRYKNKKPDKNSTTFLESVADWGYDNAQYELGLLLLDQNPKQAKYWLLRAARQKHEEAILQLKKIDPAFNEAKLEEPVYEVPFSESPKDLMDYTSFSIFTYFAYVMK